MDDEKHMRTAIRAAMDGIKKKAGGPFASCIVGPDGKLVSVAYSTVWQSCDSTAHAEINALRKACKKLKTTDLSGCTAYSTTEPCPMCFSAIHWAKIKNIVYGSTIDDATRIGFHEIKLHAFKIKSLAHLKSKIKPAVLRDECVKMLEFWKKSQK